MIDPNNIKDQADNDNDISEPIYEDEVFFNPFAAGGDADDSDYGEY